MYSLLVVIALVKTPVDELKTCEVTIDDRIKDYYG